MEVGECGGAVVSLSQFAIGSEEFRELKHDELFDLYKAYLIVAAQCDGRARSLQVADRIGRDGVGVGQRYIGEASSAVLESVGHGGGVRLGGVNLGEGTLRYVRGASSLAGRSAQPVVGAGLADPVHRGDEGSQSRDVDEAGGGQSCAVFPVDVTSGGQRSEGGAAVVGGGPEVYVPPWRRSHLSCGEEVERKKTGVGKWYERNKAARERRKRKKLEKVEPGNYFQEHLQVDEVCENSRSFFFGMPRSEVNELRDTRAQAMKLKNEADLRQQSLRLMRLRAEEAFVTKDVASGAFVNRMQARNEAMDKKWQDQAENVQSYRRAGPVQGWVKTVVSGEGSKPSRPRSAPTLSSGSSPRSESDWELEIKRRDDENAQLRAELQALIAENEVSVGWGDYDSRNFNQLEHYGSTKAGDELAMPWDQDPLVAEMYRMMSNDRN